MVVMMMFVFMFIVIIVVIVMMMVMMFMFVLIILVIVMVVMMFMFIVIIVVIIVVVMMFMFMLIIVVIIVMMVMFVFVFILIIFQLAEIFREAVGRTFHCFIDRISCQFIPGGCDDAGIRVEFADNIDISLQSLFICHLCSGQDDACGSCDLIIEEFTEIFVIDCASLCVDNSTVAVQFKTFHGLDNLQDIGKLADT